MNPYASPAETVVPASPDKKIRIDYFLINDSAYSCSVLSRAEIVEHLKAELTKFCQELGFEVVSEGADYRLSGELTRVEEGNRFLRSLVPVLLGAVIVEGRCRLIDQRGSESAFDFRKRKAMGFQGGNTRSLIELSLRQIAMKISSDIAVTTGRIGTEESLKATRYLKTMLGVAALIAVGLAALIYMWAINQPVRKDGVSASGKPAWACVVALFLFLTMAIVGLAAAPTDILTSRTLLTLRSISGVKSIVAQRLVIALLALAPIGLLFLTFWVL